MIDEVRVRKYCKEDISLIENYDKAIKDETQTWCCHHRDEVKILPSGIEVRRTREELIENDRYFNCPANELIFLTREEHCSLHMNGHEYNKGRRTWLGKHHTEESKRKMSEANKGNKIWLGKHHTEEAKRKISEANKGKILSEFGRKFFEKFGITGNINPKLYRYHCNWYNKHNKVCKWEKEA